MSKENPVAVRSFTGLNSFLPPNKIGDGDSVELANFNVGQAGNLERRTGFNRLHNGTTLGANEIRLLGFFSITTESVFLGTNGSHLFKSTDCVAWTDLGAYSNVKYGIQYANKFYMVRSTDVILSYDGTSVAALSGSPTGTWCGIFKDRLFVLNTDSTTNPSRLYFSSPGDPATWPGTNFIDVQVGDGDVLTVCAPYQDRLLIFKGRTTHVLYVQSDPSNWVLRIINTENGCLSAFGIVDIVGLIWVITARGVYRTDGITFEEVSRQVRNVFSGRSAATAALNKDHVGRFGDYILWRIRLAGGTYEYYTYNTVNNSWSKWDIQGGLNPAYFVEMLTSNPAPGLYSGDAGNLGYVSRYGDDIYLDNGVQYTSRMVSRSYDLDMPTHYKRGKWVAFETKGVGEIEIHYVVDTLEDPEVLSIEGVSTFRVHKVSGPGYFRVVSVILEFTDAAALSVFGWTMMTHVKRVVLDSGV